MRHPRHRLAPHPCAMPDWHCHATPRPKLSTSPNNVLRRNTGQPPGAAGLTSAPLPTTGNKRILTQNG
eukprot:5049521-Lingulodinium_polyedra.AAC.1